MVLLFRLRFRHLLSNPYTFSAGSFQFGFLCLFFCATFTALFKKIAAVKKVLFVLLLLLTGFNGWLLWQNSQKEAAGDRMQCSLQVAKKATHLTGPVMQGALIYFNKI